MARNAMPREPGRHTMVGKSLACVFILFGLASCALPRTPTHERADAALAKRAPPAERPWADDGPAVFGEASAAAAPRAAGDDDPALRTLIDQALRNNLDVEQARLRLDSARMERGLAERRLWPTPGVALEQRWRHGDAEHARAGHAVQRSASLTLAQPLDIGGALSLRAQAAHAQTMALDFAIADARRRLVTEVSGAYWRIAYRHREAELCEAGLRDALALATLAEARHHAGAASGDVVAQATQQVAARRGACAAITQARAAARHALRRLLADPGASLPMAPALPRVDQLPSVDAGLPAHLLSRRPDLRAHEWQVRRAMRETDATRASFYPAITLTGHLGTASDDLLQWLRQPIGSLVARLSLPFLEWRTRQWRIGAARAQERLALNGFAGALHEALREVEDGLSRRRRYLAEAHAAQTQLVAAAREEALADARHRSGDTDCAPWLERRAARRDIEARLLRLRYELALNSVTLRQALGD